MRYFTSQMFLSKIFDFIKFALLNQRDMKHIKYGKICNYYEHSANTTTCSEFQPHCKTTSYWLLDVLLCYKTLSLFLLASQLWLHIGNRNRSRSLSRCLWRKKKVQRPFFMRGQLRQNATSNSVLQIL